jgi:hypothetical protein
MARRHGKSFGRGQESLPLQFNDVPRMRFDKERFKSCQIVRGIAQPRSDGELHRPLAVVNELPKLVDSIDWPSEELMAADSAQPLARNLDNAAKPAA